MINARMESLTEKPSFRTPLRNSRCLVLSDGFFEWKLEGKRKVPYYVCLKSREPFSFAGLWSSWRSPEGKEVRSCTIITGPPNELLTPIHNRMPIILPPGLREEWADPLDRDPQTLLSLLRPYPPEEMEAYPVSTQVNSPSFDSPECIQEAKSLLK